MMAWFSSQLSSLLVVVSYKVRGVLYDDAVKTVCVGVCGV